MPKERKGEELGPFIQSEWATYLWMTGKREHSLPGKAGKLLECQRTNQQAHPGNQHSRSERNTHTLSERNTHSLSERNTHTHYGRSLDEHEL